MYLAIFCNAKCIFHVCQLIFILKKLFMEARFTLLRFEVRVYVTLQERDVKFFTETEENQAMMAPRAGVPYFL